MRSGHMSTALKSGNLRLKRKRFKFYHGIIYYVVDGGSVVAEILDKNSIGKIYRISMIGFDYNYYGTQREYKSLQDAFNAVVFLYG